MTALSILQIIYTSKASHDFSMADLRRMLKECRERNLLHKITGQLLFKDGYFIQVIEGEIELVTRLFSNITQDKRHQNVRKLSSMTTKERSYPNWTMGFSKLDHFSPQDISQCFDNVVDQKDTSQSSFLLKLLEYFRNH